ncbi:TetR family transcriptional regulator [Pectobacterium brasiliense]|nr:TetR family transcriptional regulator [Pectobacterium brasiliense]
MAMGQIYPMNGIKTGSTTKDHIVDAALEVILDTGVIGATFRRIATKAGVSPGTMTYYFSSINEILDAAFRKMVSQIAVVFRKRLMDARKPDEAVEAVVDLICGDIWATPRHMLLSFELYAFASRQPQYQTVMTEWMDKSRDALYQHYDLKTASSLDAMIEGFTIHRHLNPDVISREEVRRCVSLIANASSKNKAEL